VAEEEAMLVSISQNTGLVYLFACLVALLILAVLTSKNPPSQASEPPTAFRSGWLARVPDDVRRLKAARGARRFFTLELLANCTWECCSKVRDAIGRIRR
jgi:hypothetical protein